jgi:hypothetical protein
MLELVETVGRAAHVPFGVAAMSTTYGARTIKRVRRTQAQVQQLDAQILEEVTDDHPQAVRHVFYRMTDPRLPEPVEKTELGYRQAQHRCVELRRSGHLPYGWISDATRRGYFTPTYRNAADFLRSVAGHYRADLWQQSEWYCEVWVESRSIAGVIQADCEEFAVSLYPAGGFSSLTLAFEAAEYINSATDKPIRIFYISDYDQAGVLIDPSIERELRKHLDSNVDLSFERIAITEQQIIDLDLPTKPRKAGDKRSPHVKSTVEAEAMPAHVLRRLLRQRIEALLPPDALKVAQIAEQSERLHLELIAARLNRRGAAP